MHPTTRAWYELKFELLVSRKRGNEFQDFFSEIMTLAHRSDFVKVRPWGSYGDRKNDGYIISSKELFQVYAPAELEDSVAARKITEDFEGAIHHWSQDVSKWTFVHNSLDGIGPKSLALLLEISRKHPQRQLSFFTPDDLRRVVFSLSTEDIAKILGPAFEAPAPSRITFNEIRTALEHIARVLPEAPESVGEVDYGKLDANGLNKNNRQLIRWGYSVTHRVADFLNEYTFDPELGQKVAATLRIEYLRLKQTGLGPNEIFRELLTFVSNHREETDTASIAVLAHFFQSCDIFEAAHTFNQSL